PFSLINLAPSHRPYLRSMLALLSPIPKVQAIASIEPVYGVWWATYLLYPQVRPSHPSSQSMACGGPLTSYIHRSGHRIHRASSWRVVGHLHAISIGQAIASIEPVHDV